MQDKISSKINSNIKLVTKLINYRKHRDSQMKAVIIGKHLIEEFLPTKQLEFVMVNESKLDHFTDLVDILIENNIKLYFVAGDVYQSILNLDADICAVIMTAKNTFISNDLYSQDCVVLEEIQDPGNLGAILRVAAASGIKNVFISNHGVDLYNPKVLRGAQGLLTKLNIFTEVDNFSFLSDYRGQVLITTPHADSSIYELNLIPSTAWVYGNEGSGVSDKLLNSSQFTKISIPMSIGVESMNVSTACAVCLFEQVRQKKLLVK